MNIHAESYGHAVVLNLKGDLVEDTLSAVRQAVDHELQAREIVDVVLNLSGVTSLDSVALEYLLELQERLTERLGRVRLLQCDENVRKVLEITRLLSEFDLFDDVNEAIKPVEV